MQIINIETKTILGNDYSLIRGYSEAPISESDYRAQVEAYGQELVSFQRIGNIYNIEVAL